ncbi:MAG: hypothetical protein ACKOW3_02365 [Hyphomicrobium sp.]
MCNKKINYLACLSAFWLILLQTSSEAGWVRNRGYNGLEKGYVVAQSRYGNGTVTGPVRKGPKGLQVRTPGGNWFYCRASCSETLRAETVDQWENQGEMIGVGTAPLECGIFGCLDISARFRD